MVRKCGLDGSQLVIGRHVQHRIVFIVELAMAFGRIAIFFIRVHVEIPVALCMVARIHRDETGILQETMINLALKTRIVRRHHPIYDGVFKLAEWLFGSRVVDIG